MIRTQQAQLQQIQQSTGALPATSTAAVDDSTPTSERSFSFHNVSAPLPASITNTRPRSPGPRGSLDLSRHSSRRSRPSSRTTSPALLPLSAGLHGESNEWLLSGGGNGQGSRDESAFYQAETQMLTRENLMLRMRIRELGRYLPLPIQGRKKLSLILPARTERQVNELNAAPANSPATASNLTAPPMEADSVSTPTARSSSAVDSSGPKDD